MITWTINSRDDIKTWVQNELPEADDVERVTDAIQAADHPAWGRDWTEWLAEHGEEFATEVRR